MCLPVGNASYQGWYGEGITEWQTCRIGPRHMTHLKTNQLLAKLQRVKQDKPNHWMALCPSHDDTSPSLSVTEKDDCILVSCLANSKCNINAVLKAIDLTPKDLFLSENGYKSQMRKQPPSIIKETIWNITGANGEVVAQHVRLDYSDGPKSFRWRRDGTDGLGGIKTSNLPLYGLKWAIDEPDDSNRDWIITEGEKAADALHNAGYLALGTVTGASSCPSADSLIPLLGRKGRIILWPDNDDAGKQHMYKVAEQLREMDVECYILNWPEAPPKGDAADFIDSGGDVTSLSRNKTYVCIYRSDIITPASNRTKIGQNVGHLATSEKDMLCPKTETLSQKVRAWIEQTSGWWGIDELDRDLGITGIQSKDYRGKILRRLKESCVIEQHPQINKKFRYVNTQTTSLNFKSATKTGVLPIKWPLGIEKYVNLFPGNLAVVAGSPNAGKTGLLLNFIHLNQGQFPIYYFCSEMGDVELRDRLDKFPGMDIDDWHFEAIERASDFSDVIRPDCVNVIDFLEMTTELYLVNTYLTAICQKLGSGIAVVALQKKQGATFGRGQEFGLEKPKLYVSLDKGKLQIIKGKSWATKNVDPNGLQASFKIVDGCQFQITNRWDWPR